MYAPIGCGSGICGVIAWRDALGLKTRVVGVVSENAPCYALSFETGRPVEARTADTFADGLAVRVPVPEALDAVLSGAERFGVILSGGNIDRERYLEALGAP